MSNPLFDGHTIAVNPDWSVYETDSATELADLPVPVIAHLVQEGEPLEIPCWYFGDFREAVENRVQVEKLEAMFTSLVSVPTFRWGLVTEQPDWAFVPIPVTAHASEWPVLGMASLYDASGDVHDVRCVSRLAYWEHLDTDPRQWDYKLTWGLPSVDRVELPSAEVMASCLRHAAESCRLQRRASAYALDETSRDDLARRVAGHHAKMRENLERPGTENESEGTVEEGALAASDIGLMREEIARFVRCSVFTSECLADEGPNELSEVMRAFSDSRL